MAKWLMAYGRWTMNDMPSAISHVSELDVSGDRVGESAKIDLPSRKTLIGRQIALRVLITNLEPEIPVRHRRPQTAQNHRPRCGPAADKRRGEDGAVGGEELSGFGVAPRKHARARADV